jgi:hypothetical protein
MSQDGKGQVAIGHNACEPLWVAHQDRADVVVGHGAGGLVGFGLPVEGDDLASAKTLKRHWSLLTRPKMANEASSLSKRFRLKLP